MVTRPGQDAYDISIQSTGQIDNLFDMIIANPWLKLDSDPIPGQTINVPAVSAITGAPMVVNQKVIDYFKLNNFQLNNGGKASALLAEDGETLQNEDLEDLLGESN